MAIDFELSEEQQILKKSTRDFLEAECPEKFVRDIEKGIWDGGKGYSPEQWRKIADLGWLGMPFPEQYGGTGNSILDVAVLFNEIGRAMFPSPFLSTVVLCGLAILDAGSEEQKAEFLPKIAKGDLILAFALTEPSASYEADGVQVKATADGDSYVINGTKLFVHDAKVADYILCVTRTGSGAKAENGITLFLVDAKSPGVSSNLLYTTPGDMQCEVVFNKVKVPKKNMVGKLNGGWSTVEKVMQHGAVLLCAQMAGAERKILELCVEHARTRIQFDAPIGIHQWLQEHVVNLYAYMKCSEDYTYYAAWMLGSGRPADLQVAVAKAWVGDQNEKACWHGHQVLGGSGGQVDAGLVPLFSRRGKGMELYLGDGAYWRKKIANVMDGWTLPMPKGKPVGLFDRREPQC